MENGEISLFSLFEGEEGLITQIEGGRGLISRLAAMGIVPGTRIRVLRKRAGLLIIASSSTRIALAKGQAQKIMVKRLKERETLKERKEKREILVALCGQPNVGKSTIFNIITGLSQYVANWPGKTVERKEGVYVKGEYEIKIVDLPGTYSLSAFSEEERIARDFIIHEHPDVIVLITNASALERGLYLLSELLLFKRPVILVLNMLDVAESQGIHIDLGNLERALKIPVIPTIATKNFGIKELISEIIKVANSEHFTSPEPPEVLEDHKEIYGKIERLIKGYIPPPYTEAYVIVKLMEGDPEVTELAKEFVPVEIWNEIKSSLLMHEDTVRAVAGGRYDWIEKIKRQTITEFKREEFLITDRIDHALTHPFFGLLILIFMVGLLFFITFKIGLPLQGLIERVLLFAERSIEPFLNHSRALKALIIDGALGGVGAVLSLTPVLLIFFLFLGLLEDVGYMARAAFIMDRIMHLIGLHGKSFLPLCLGIGCNVPSVMGSRIIESNRARLLTIFLTPFVPCTARLSVLTLLTTIFFSERGMIISWILVSLNILLLFLTGLFIKIFFLKRETIPFIMELPLFHKPNLRTIFISLWLRLKGFFQKAGTLIFLFSIIFSLFHHFPEEGEGSILGYIGYILSPLGWPLGFDWKMLTALLSGFLAKENAIATLGILYGTEEEGLREVLPQAIEPSSALAFLTMLMLYIPCLATTVVMKKELANKKWFLSSLLSMLLISYIMGIIVYNLSKYLFSYF